MFVNVMGTQSLRFPVLNFIFNNIAIKKQLPKFILMEGYLPNGLDVRKPVFGCLRT